MRTYPFHFLPAKLLQASAAQHPVGIVWTSIASLPFGIPAAVFIAGVSRLARANTVATEARLVLHE